MTKTIFFIVPYPIDEAPSQRFRFEQYLTILNEQGYEIEIHPFLDLNTWKSLYETGKVFKKIKGIINAFYKRLKLLFKLKRADYIFIHREASHIGPPIFEWIIAKVLRRRYIYDFDDAIWLPNYSEQNAKFHRLKAYWKIEYCMKWAYKISAGNQYLASYASQFNKNIKIIPTTIDTFNYHTINSDHNTELVTIGWTGTHTTMRYLIPLVPVLQNLEQELRFRFVVISNEAPTFELNCLEYIKWSKQTEIADLSQFHIGVMPLEHDIWSEGKCGFKGLQYMSLGIASVMSPVGVNTSIVHHGKNGFLATTPDEWYEVLKNLIIDRQLREKIGFEGKATVETTYSVRSIQSQYLELFNE